ncbi:MSMEG_1061 family FMN-dependent PPOX-type flavoprotein [Actinomycetospora rhizophila]|uniref:MSMEG_1061 family FMN-dependent PPOX-type flavoprotein n=1 Tax=Actinomycetospora rhizophila TaxID=1416876 RepID=A0ABV9ZJ82_9PSEU
MPEITELAELRALVSEPPAFIAEKAIDHVDDASRRFLAASPFFVLATTGADGSVDVSPRGDPAGQVLVLDGGKAVAFADRPGNHRLDSFRNILSHPEVGMLFLVPGRDHTLRINGRARIFADPEFADRFAVRGRRPELAVVVEIDELFLHCAKAFARSSLWDPASWPGRGDVPSAGTMAKSISGTHVPAGEIDAALATDVRTNQY